ncbi:hypothetical protein JTB14_014536 [Gonioctena quinquepunctata]|nr:hypothetical protein JTB14_014536 [Gonioctena quinquepunctata]
MEDISELDLKPKSHSEPGTPISKQKNTIEKPPSTQLPSTQMNDKADTTLKEATNIQGTPKTGATNKNTEEPPRGKPNTTLCLNTIISDCKNPFPQSGNANSKTLYSIHLLYV